MPNPNIINTTTCTFEQQYGGVNTTATTILSLTSGKLKKVVSLYFCNTTSSTITIDLYDSNPGTNRYYLKSVDIPGKATLVAVTKDSPIHFEDFTHTLVAQAVSTGIDYHINWEEYDDA